MKGSLSRAGRIALVAAAACLGIAPAGATARARTVDQRGKAAKLRFRQITTDPFFAKLTHGFATRMSRFGTGVRIETSDIAPPADGADLVRGRRHLVRERHDEPRHRTGRDPLKVTGGTGRYRGARGTLAYTLLTPPGTSGLQVTRLRGTLRFR